MRNFAYPIRTVNFRRGGLSLTVFGAILAALVAGAMPARATSGEMVVTTSTTLTEDHQGSILIRGNGITLDCAGHRVTGPGFAGIDVRLVSGTTVKNCNVSGFHVGFFVWSSPGNTLVGNASANNEAEGFALASSSLDNSGNTLTDNTATGNATAGFAVYDNSANTTLSRNAAIRGKVGFLVGVGSSGAVVSGNLANENRVDGIDIESDQNQLLGNTATSNGNNGSSSNPTETSSATTP